MTWFHSAAQDVTYVRGYNSSASPGDAAFAYVNVWKSGNNFIDGVQIKQMMCKETCRGCELSSKARDAIAWPRPFTFVRDPWSHFVSGYGEATYRTFVCTCHPSMAHHCQPPPGLPCEGELQNGTDLACEALLELLDARTHYYDPQHYCAQAGLFSRRADAARDAVATLR